MYLKHSPAPKQASHTSDIYLYNSTMVKPSSQPSDMYLYNNPYAPYFSASYYTIKSFYIMYIPFIIVSSSLVIATVILLKKQQNQHNIFLLAVAIFDLSIAVIVIPTRVLLEIAVTREEIYSDRYRGLCVILDTIADFLEVSALNSLTLLGLDTVTQVTFPIHYRRYSSIKKAIVYLVSSDSVHLLCFLTLTFLRFLTNFNCSELSDNWRSMFYHRYFTITVGTLLLFCFVSGIYVRYKRFMLVNSKRKTTSWLLMIYIIFYMPTFLLLVKVGNFEKDENEIWMHKARLVRYLSSVTNGPFIFYFRPTYKFAFKYFIRTNPIHWNKLEMNYENKRRNTLSAYSTRAASLNNSNPSRIDHESEKTTGLNNLNKKETNYEHRLNDGVPSKSTLSESSEEKRSKDQADNIRKAS